MARNIKIDNSQKKRFSRNEKRRNVEIKTPRLYFLIVCEGEKTEPNYFKQLKRNLPIGVVDVQMEIEGAARNTNSLVEYTKRYEAQSKRKFDRIWVVFDKDSFSEANFNDAIQNANNNGIKAAWTNEAFELWFLLHFELVSHKMSRNHYKGFLETHITKKIGKPYEYKKNDPNTYITINKYGSQAQATKWAKKLEANFDCTKYATHNPCTKIHKLVEELENPELVWKEINECLKGS